MKFKTLKIPSYKLDSIILDWLIKTKKLSRKHPEYFNYEIVYSNGSPGLDVKIWRPEK